MGWFSRKPAPARPALGMEGGARSEDDTGDRLEPRTIELGTELLDLARGRKAGIFSTRFYSDKLMNWSMRDHDFKVQLFRFVDAFPMLTTPEMVHDHLVDYLGQPGVKLPPGMDLGLRAGGVAKGLMTSTITGQIKSMAGKFIAGTDARSALGSLRTLWDDGIAFSVDLLGEACVSDAEADEYKAKYLDLIENLPGEVSAWPGRTQLERDHLGGIPRVNVSIKISSLSARCDPIDTDGAIADLMTRLEPILETARDRGVLVNFDMEQFALKDLTLELFERCCDRIDFQAGLAMQAYLRSGVEDAARIAEFARTTGRIVTVRLVKGAYWDYETIHAEQMGWPCPVWNEKWQTDLCFERMADVLIDACPGAGDAGGPAGSDGLGPARVERGRGGIKPALGSHNVRSIARALARAESRGLSREAVELQMLHGMADELKSAASELGLRVREYVPVGEMIPGMAYLVRRLLENTSNESWLKAGFMDRADASALLAPPAPRRGNEPSPGTTSNGAPGGSSNGSPDPNQSEKRDLCEIGPERHMLAPAVEGVGDGRPFMSEPPRDFSQRAQRESFAAAIERCRVPDITIADDPSTLERDFSEAQAYFPTWRDTDPHERAAVLTRCAQLMRDRRDELAGIVIKENGKGWHAADGDVCEAIDFMEFYARHAIGLCQPTRLGRFIGELDEQWYQPRGVAVVISPWNFPLAIATGMSTAALVTGNTVLLKPAEQTPGIASVLRDLLYEAGCPRAAFKLLPGTGEVTGASLVRDPRTSLIAFTGSKAVGLDIIRAAGDTHEGQWHVKKVVCEMGGKNAIIVDVSADLDEAVLGTRESAFGFQGQRCSACSRVIVVDPDGPNGEHTRTFLRRFVESTRSLVIGDPRDPGTDVGHVIDDEARDKIQSMIELGKREGCRLELAMDVPEELEQRVARPYVGPHIFSGVTPEHSIARDEIFGPVVAVMHARTYEDALQIANQHPYKLTGGVFTRKPAHIDRAKRDFRVGNLYINRGIVGSLVGRQPFGGFGMSGIGSKAGSWDYLLQFVEPRASCENTMRRGFAPEL